ncbi:hypothetical protein EIK77_001418 [Talaromyces pinophilus]|nr:hypothetical protein EIK77_001418 [Talaromyces pinophilus]PCH02141.1 Hypothetical protein PENO1_039200 [Penicillium occitanis (nom. inval.)]PCH03123.1 hypothetical protein PENOC_040160 [Penicillium occitanis (nom. inval.)]
MSLPGILRLPTEILVSIFEFKDLQPKWKDAGSIPNIRLTCQRFCALSSHLLIRKVYVDISKPETIDRLQSIAADAGLAKGVREVYLRLHFYHSWVAASFKNFASSVESEWRQRTSPQDYFDEYHLQGCILRFEQIAYSFIRRLDRTVVDDASHHGLEQQSTDNDLDTPGVHVFRPNLVLQQAYKIYKAGYESQNRVMRNGNFNSVFSESLSKFKDLRCVTIYDRELNNNYSPGTTIRVPQEDHVGQEAALVTVFSRPMVWEDSQWIQPNEEIRQGVPVELLVEIPIAIGATKVDYLDIQVTAAPDYSRLPTSPETLSLLSAAIDSMNVFQFGFQPRCTSGCGPWAVSFNDDAEDLTTAGLNAKSAAELEALDRYLGTILDCNCIEYADINLGEFWYSAGFDSIREAPGSLGTSWFHESARPRSLHLTQVPLTMADLERIVIKAMVVVDDDGDDDELEINLQEVYLCNGTWKQFLETLRMAKRNDIKVSFAYLLGGGMDKMDHDAYSLVWRRLEDGGSMVQQYIRGRTDRNPLE